MLPSKHYPLLRLMYLSVEAAEYGIYEGLLDCAVQDEDTLFRNGFPRQSERLDILQFTATPHSPVSNRSQAQFTPAAAASTSHSQAPSLPNTTYRAGNDAGRVNFFAGTHSNGYGYNNITTNNNNSDIATWQNGPLASSSQHDPNRNPGQGRSASRKGGAATASASKGKWHNVTSNNRNDKIPSSIWRSHMVAKNELSGGFFNCFPEKYGTQQFFRFWDEKKKCCRCGVVFSLTKSGEQTAFPSTCVYHWDNNSRLEHYKCCGKKVEETPGCKIQVICSTWLLSAITRNRWKTNDFESQDHGKKGLKEAPIV